MLEAARLKEGLREHARGLADAAGRSDPSARVPTCPDWTLRDLVGHVGQAHRWAAHLLRTGGAGAAREELPRGTPGSPVDWPGWLDDGVETLISAYEADRDATVEHPLLGTWPAVSWLRRMTHETIVHRADAALTAGTPFGIAPDLAADAISEALDLLTRTAAAELKPELAELRGAGETLLLRPDEPSRPGWLITRGAAGPAWERLAGGDGGDGAGVTVRGPVRDLLLVLARRLAPDDADAVRVTGDRSLLDHWIAHTAV